MTHARMHMLLHNAWYANHAFIFTVFLMKNDSSDVTCHHHNICYRAKGPLWPYTGLIEDYTLRLWYFPRKFAWPIGGFSQSCWRLSAKSLVLTWGCSRYRNTVTVTAAGSWLAWHHMPESFLFWWVGSSGFKKLWHQRNGRHQLSWYHQK